MQAVIRQIIPQSGGQWLALVVGVLSVLKLIQMGVDSGFGTTLQILLQYYEDLTDVLFGSWAGEIVRFIFEKLRTYIGIELHLYPQWKHVFVLMGIYFFRDASTAFAQGNTGRATFRGVWGIIVALLASTAAGAILLTKASISANFLVGAIPILFVLLYDLGDAAWAATLYRERYARIYHHEIKTWWQAFSRHLFQDSLRTVVGLVTLAAGLQLPFVQSLPSPGLSLLGSLVFALTFYWLYLGVAEANALQEKDEPWLDAFLRTGNANLGFAILRVYVWVGMFIIANAGLGPYGL